MNNEHGWSFPGSFFQSMVATIQTIRNSQIMDQIERSCEDVKWDRVRPVREFIKELYSDCGDMQ